MSATDKNLDLGLATLAMLDQSGLRQAGEFSVPGLPPANYISETPLEFVERVVGER